MLATNTLPLTIPSVTLKRTLQLKSATNKYYDNAELVSTNFIIFNLVEYY